MRFAGIIFLSGLLTGCATTQPQLSAAEEVAWILGCWETENGSQEVWTIADYPIVIWGEGRQPGPDGPELTEKLTISPAGHRFQLLAEPVKQTAQIFFETERDETFIRFVNADHDYPQVISYQREADQLLAEISLMDGSKARQWQYFRCGD